MAIPVASSIEVLDDYSVAASAPEQGTYLRRKTSTFDNAILDVTWNVLSQADKVALVTEFDNSRGSGEVSFTMPSDMGGATLICYFGSEIQLKRINFEVWSASAKLQVVRET